MNAGLNGPKIVSGSQHDRIYTSHNALIMGYGTVRLGFRTLNRLHKLLRKSVGVRHAVICQRVTGPTYFISYQTFSNIISPNAHDKLYVFFFSRKPAVNL